MQQHWVEVESIFRTSGIYFELKGWSYRCLIDGRYFYYSPNTGKWRLKGKMLWLPSSSPDDFMAQAKVYSPPDYKSRASEKQNNQEKSSTNQKTKRKKKTQQKTYSYSYQNSGQGCDGIRPEFLSIFGNYLQKQRKRGYKIGWIWYKLIEDLTPSIVEICWLSVIFGYSKSWAVHKVRDFHGLANSNNIYLTITAHKYEWLSYFEQRWGNEEEESQQQERERYQQQYEQQKQQKQQRQNSSKQHHSKASGFVHHTHLKLLGLTFPFTWKELKKAYRQMALQAHPDTGGTSEAFRQIHHAYETLSLYANN